MTPAEYQRAAHDLEPGEVVHVVWLDSGADLATPHDTLSARNVYGQFLRVEEDEHYAGTWDLLLSIDTCRSDPEDGSLGRIWVPSILELHRLRRV